MAVEGWQETTFGKTLDIQGGTQPPKSTFVYEPQDGYVRLIQIRDFESDDYPAYIKIGSKSNLCEADDILIARYGASLGRICTGKAGAYNVALAKVVFKTNAILRDYLYYWLKSPLFQDHLLAVGGRSAQAGFNKEDLAPLRIDLPPIAEQTKIAEVLGSVDEAIAKTEAVLVQTQKVKQGLLQTLLTKGIGHTKFKQTEIGEIPEGWEVSSIEQLSDRVTSGSRGWAEYYSEEGAAFIRITNLKRDCIYPDMSDLKRVQLPAGSAEGVRTRVRVGDVLISITADLGVIGYIKDDNLGEAYVNQHISLVSLNPKRVHAGFAAYFLSAPFMQRHIQKLNDGGAKAGLNLPTIRRLPIPLPDMNEQTHIFQTLKETDDYLLESKEQMLTLQNLKKGLMSDLLTGRVRAKLDKKSEKAA
ncbi:MAG TPA: restriction endonuclease subunit S [Alphaproteobacteria bacterium]|nr:restriction endonuclease subunit S [Alphaproteobacteria bacterium]